MSLLPVQTPSAESASREWFTAAEIAELALPGLPADKRSVNRRARDERWQSRCDVDGSPLARQRAGRGGGMEFHVSLLPGPARLELAARGLAPGNDDSAPLETPEASAWRWYEAQSGKVKAAAEARAAVIAEIDLLTRSGLTRSAAVPEAARRHGKSPATVWNWIKLVAGIAPSDRLPALAPRRFGGGREAEIDPELWTIFKSDYLRPSAPTLASCYHRLSEIAAEKGLSLPCQTTLRRRIEAEVAPQVILLARKGEEALRRSIPAQRRTVDHLEAMECVNIDGHKFDVWVMPPNADKETKPIRPLMVAIQDIRSSKFLAWRVCETESAFHVRLAFADLFEGFGIPKSCTLDNGRGFASKWITGGAPTRNRFKIKDEDPTGILTVLGIEIHWALPYRGQSKPIERAFRDLCDSVARHPAMEGAYTGNSVLSKPENYRSRAIGWTEFCDHVDRQIASHNARLGRKGRDYRGRSFDQVFAESYATAQVRKATPAQLRMALLAAEQKTVDKQTGEIGLFGNRYWSQECGQYRGQKVTVRFDPDNLSRDIHLYGLDGRYLASAEKINDSGFDDVAEAKRAAKRWANYRKLTRAAFAAEELLTPAEVAQRQAGITLPELPEPGIIQMVHPRGRAAAAVKAMPNPQLVARQESEDRLFTAFRVIESKGFDE